MAASLEFKELCESVSKHFSDMGYLECIRDLELIFDRDGFVTRDDVIELVQKRESGE